MNSTQVSLQNILAHKRMFGARMVHDINVYQIFERVIIQLNHTLTSYCSFSMLILQQTTFKVLF